MATTKYSPVQMLWVGGPLSVLERLALTSWLENGHEVHLYSYGKPANTPKGLRICDAREILPPQADTQSSASGQAPVPHCSARLRQLHAGGWLGPLKHP